MPDAPGPPGAPGGPDRRGGPGGPITFAAAIGCAVALAAITGNGLVTGASRAATVLPIAMAGAAALGWLALTRFAAFVIAILAVRASLDIAKLGGRLDARREAGTATASDWLDPGALLGLLFTVAAVLWLAAQSSGRRTTAATGPGTAPNPVPVPVPTPAPGEASSAPHRSGDRRMPGLPVAAGALVGAGLLSVLGSTVPATSAAEVLRITTVLLMIFVVGRLVSARPVRRNTVLAAVFAAAVPPVLVTAGQLVTGGGLTDVHGGLRPAGTFWHPNSLGAFCALLLVMGLALLPHLRGGPRTGLLVALPGIGFALVAAGARGPWLAALTGAVVVALLQDRRLLLWLGGTVAAVVAFVPSVPARLSDLSSASSPESAQDSLSWRFEHWRETLGLLHENPVTGIGLGATRTVLGREVHNDYLRALVETGVLGLAAYLGLFAALAVTAHRALRRTAGEVPAGTRARTRTGAPATAHSGTASVRRGMAVGFAGCLALLMVYGLADNVMTSVAVMWYFAAFAGLAYGLGTEPETRADPALEGAR